MNVAIYALELPYHLIMRLLMLRDSIICSFESPKQFLINLSYLFVSIK